MPAPTPMKISEAVAHIKEKHGLTVTRQTVYNWTKAGKKGLILKAIKRAGTTLTTKEWVDTFVANAGL